MEPFLGQIQIFGFPFAPRGYAFCDGQLLPISSHQALFSLLGTSFGGDGRTTFALPDLRGRSMVHPGTGPGLSPVRHAEAGGTEAFTLSVAQLPAHSHILRLGDDPADTNAGDGAFLAAESADASIFTSTPTGAQKLGGGTVRNTGRGEAVPHRPPYLAIHHCMALQGLYPSRS